MVLMQDYLNHFALCVLLVASVLAQDASEESTEIVCPVYECEYIPYYRCATINLPTITLNPCGADMRCDFLEGFQTAILNGEEELKCYSNYDDTTVLTVDTILADMQTECAKLSEYQSSPTLTVDRESFVCSDSSECVTSAGTTTTCVCSGDSLPRCTMSPGDSAFVERAEAGCIDDKEAFIMRALEIFIGNTMIGAPDCLYETFADFKWYTYLDEGGLISIFYDANAVWLGVSAVLATLVL